MMELHWRLMANGTYHDGVWYAVTIAALATNERALPAQNQCQGEGLKNVLWA